MKPVFIVTWWGKSLWENVEFGKLLLSVVVVVGNFGIWKEIFVFLKIKTHDKLWEIDSWVHRKETLFPALAAFPCISLYDWIGQGFWLAQEILWPTCTI